MAEEARTKVWSGVRDGLSLTVSADHEKMKLFLAAEPQRDLSLLSADSLKAILSNFVHPPTWHDDVLVDICRQLQLGKSVPERRVGKGRAIQEGVDGRLLLLVKPFRGVGTVAPTKSGGVDFRELHLFDNIPMNSVVARIYPPKPAIAGLTVFGKEIKPPAPRPAAVTLDKSLMRRPAPSVEGSYEEIVSLLAGALTESSGKLSVIEDLSFSEGIDLSVGSVRFLGSVTVRGDVAAGIAVSGDKGVSISGDSRESRIESASGDVTVKGFLFGGSRGLVRAGRNCSVSVAHDATIEAIGDIFIEREAFGSTLRAGATVRGPRAKIRGGSLAVVCGIELFELGSSGGERVRVDLCSSNEVQREYVELVAKQQQVEQLLILARLHLGPLAVNPARIQLLSPTHRQKMAALHKRLLDLQLSAARLESQRKALAGGSTASPTMRVNILGTLFPGVVIHHAEERFSVQEPLRGPKSIDFDPTTGQFVVQELKALECSFSPQVQKKEKGR